MLNIYYGLLVITDYPDILYPFLKAPKSEHIYKSDSTLGKALSLYEFDRELRLLLFNQIERIELASQKC